MSINTQMYMQQSRRDDIESMAYLLIHICRPRGLPWGPKFSSSKVLRLKRQTPISQLCKDVPEQLGKLLQYARELNFQESPDYHKITELLKEAGSLLCEDTDISLDDGLYDWSILATLVVHYPYYYKDLLTKYYNNNGGNLQKRMLFRENGDLAVCIRDPKVMENIKN